MKAIKENWKLVLIVAAGIVAVIFMCIFGVQGAQNKAFALEEQVNTADSDIKVQEKRRVDLVYNLADCVKQYDKHEAETLNNARKYFTVGDQFFSPGNKRDWWQMIQLLPSSYNQTRNVMMNYEVLANIYKSRKDHKLDEWRNFCKWIEELPYSELITGGKR